MPLYHMTLKSGGRSVIDRDGEEFPDETAARAHAITTARELMRNHTVDARFWRLEVSDEDLHPCFELLFASIDDSISHLPPEFRNSIEIACRNTASLKDTIAAVYKSLEQVRETLSQADQIVDRISLRSEAR